MAGNDFEARLSQYISNLNSGMNSEQAASAVRSGGTGNANGGSTNTNKSSISSLSQQNLAFTKPLSSINNLKLYRENQQKTSVERAGDIVDDKQTLEKKLDEVNNALAYAWTIEENDALQAQRKDILDQLHEIDRLSGETLKSYDARERAGNVVTGATDSTASSYVNLMGTAAGVGNTLNEASRVEDRMVASSDYAGWATDELTAGNIAGSISYEEMEENEQRRREEEQRLYDIADSLSYRSAEKTAAAKEGLGTVGKFGVDLTQQFIQQGIDAGGRLLGLGMLPFFARATGGAMGEARQAGASSGQQLLYGFTVGGIEAAIEKVSGSNKLFGKGVLDKAILGLADKAKSPAVRSAVQILLGGISEGGEGVLSDILNPFAKLIYDNNALAETWADRDEYKVQMLQDFLIGAAMGLVGEGVSSGVNAIAQNTQQNTINPTEKTSLQNVASPQNTQQSASDIPGNIQTPPAEQNAHVVSPALFNTQSNAAAEVQKNTAQEAAETTAVDDNPNTHTPEQMASIEEYKNSVDTSMVNYIERVRNGEKLSPYNVAPVTNRAAADILRLTGKMTYGNTVVLDKNGVDHIDKRHGGEKGSADATMKNAEDIARIGYVLNNYDDAYLSKERAKGYLGSDGKTAPKVVFVKKIDGTYIAVEAVCDTKSKKNYIVSAFISSTGTDRLKIAEPQQTSNTLENQSPEVYVRNANAENSATSTIPNSGQNVNGNFRERGFSENIRTDAAMEEEVRAAFETDPSLYQQQSNSDTLAKAQEIYSKGTYEASKQIRDAIANAKKGFKLPVEMIPLSRLVANDLAQQGKVQEARDMLADIATELTYYGQASQAARILRDSDPMTQATAIERLVSRLNDDLTRGQKTKNINRGLSETGEIVLNQNLLNEYVKETDPAVKDQILSEMQQDIADQIPATFVEKFTAMRYLNMLGNLKTQGRNIIGNTAMLGVTKSKNLVKASIEGLASAVTGGKYERTTSFYVNSELRKEANADADLMMDELSGQGKYSDANRVSNKDIQDKRRIFDLEFLEKYRKLTNWAMETGDRVFLKATYSDALGGWLQAHGINSISEATPEQLSKARAFAMKEAQEATFRDSNAISDWVSNFGRSKTTKAPFRVISEGIAPFRKTPANVAVRAVEYSPLGVAETIVKGIQTKSGKANATDVINSLSKNIIGSALFAAGMLVYSAGFARGTEDDEELDQFQKMQGAQDYSIKLRINGEDTYVSLSQFAPAAVPFFIGVEFSNALQSEGNFVDKLPKIIGAVSGPMLEMSMLGGINDALSNLSTYGNTSSGLPMLFVNSTISYLTQVLTSTFLGQLEQANEEYRQTTYTDKNSIIPTWLQYPLGKAAAKTPGIDYNQQDYIDAWGRRQSNGNALQRFLNATVNPTYYSAERGTSVDAELERLYSENKNVEGFPNVLPDKAARSTEYTKGNTLTPEEYQQYSIDRGQMSLELIQDFMSGNDYQLLTDQQRAEVINNLYSLAADRAMKKVKTSNGVEYTGDLDDEASLSDIPAYYSYSTIMREAAFGKPTTDWQSVMKMMQNFTSLPDDVKTALKGKSDMHLKAVEYATNNGLSPEDWYKTYDVIKDAKVSTGSEAQVVAAIAINGTNKNLSDSDKLMMLQSQLPLANDGSIPTIVRRYDVAMNSFDISFDDWTKFETSLKEAGSTGEWTIRSVAQSVGINPDDAVKIYKTLYDDPKYTAQVNEEFLYLNPVDESGEVEPMSFTEYYNSFNEDQTQQSQLDVQKEVPSYIKELTNLQLTNSTPVMQILDYNTLMSMVK